MSERIRSLESAYRASGEASDLLAWLRAQQRAGLAEVELAPWLEALTAGRLHPEQLELAAYLGDPLARLLDEERAISLATYLGEGLELVPLVLGESCDDEYVVGHWVHSLARWSESWVVEAQLAIAEEWYRRDLAAPPAAPIQPDYSWDLQLEYRERELAQCRELLDASWACLAHLNDGNLQRLHALREPQRDHPPSRESARAVKALTLRWGSDPSEDPWVKHHLGAIYVGPEPTSAPEWIRAALLPKVLQAF